ncbi:hypothetical protein Zmor_009099 [Zophobas morio]|uniref:Uncharacterized protein n=1 Tax=Zophobas morio TaxID=2755281 RepID=A0AA38IFW2_9CUCU|nr:hypothetical protein Zmor_009099 [Zophobas morio]
MGNLINSNRSRDCYGGKPVPIRHRLIPSLQLDREQAEENAKIDTPPPRVLCGVNRPPLTETLMLLSFPHNSKLGALTASRSLFFFTTSCTLNGATGQWVQG